jgi:Flp pilus assembly protein TadB
MESIVHSCHPHWYQSKAASLQATTVEPKTWKLQTVDQLTDLNTLTRFLKQRLTKMKNLMIIVLVLALVGAFATLVKLLVASLGLVLLMLILGALISSLTR